MELIVQPKADNVVGEIGEGDEVSGYFTFRLADAVWPKLAAGCHLSRDTEAAIAGAGFAIDACERFGFRAAPMEPRLSYVLGRARRQ